MDELVPNPPVVALREVEYARTEGAFDFLHAARADGLRSSLSGEVRLSPAARTGPLRQDLHARLNLLLGRIDSLRGCERPRHVVQGSRRTWRDSGWRHSECPSGACDCRWLRRRRGHKKALGRGQHTAICAVWHMLSTGERYRGLGGDYFTRRDTNDARRDSSNSSNS